MNKKLRNVLLYCGEKISYPWASAIFAGGTMSGEHNGPLGALYDGGSGIGEVGTDIVTTLVRTGDIAFNHDLGAVHRATQYGMDLAHRAQEHTYTLTDNVFSGLGDAFTGSAGYSDAMDLASKIAVAYVGAKAIKGIGHIMNGYRTDGTGTIADRVKYAIFGGKYSDRNLDPDRPGFLNRAAKIGRKLVRKDRPA